MNTDRRISAKEMQRWIMEKTAEHFQEAVKENKIHFRAVDPDGDGTGPVPPSGTGGFTVAAVCLALVGEAYWTGNWAGGQRVQETGERRP